MLLKLTYSNEYNIMILKLIRDMNTIAPSVTQRNDRAFIIISVKLIFVLVLVLILMLVLIVVLKL